MNERLKSKVEDKINESLFGDMREAALGFVAWMHENKMTPEEVSRTREENTERGRNKFYRDKSAEAIVPKFFGKG